MFNTTDQRPSRRSRKKQRVTQLCVGVYNFAAIVFPIVRTRRRSRPRERRDIRANRNFQRERGIGVAHFFEPDHQHDLPLFNGKHLQRNIEVAHFKALSLKPPTANSVSGMSPPSNFTWTACMDACRRWFANRLCKIVKSQARKSVSRSNC